MRTGPKKDKDDEEGYGYPFSDMPLPARPKPRMGVLVRALHQRFAHSPVSGLKRERTLVAKLDDTLQRLSGHRGEDRGALSQRHPVSGMPP